ncbi:MULTISPECIES: radical SAM protein [Bradyrhizobium]|uniref:radical SAM protein n=1 Tax=Bradyrhizobium TaxID=374 RepID=UPI000A01BA29|nr:MULTISPECIES: radical SAM protein [Bradyrhizobium]UFW51339.1 radical SAM protein [Bradyrhizobium arachidis]
MQLGTPASIAFGHLRIGISSYCNLRCKHCYVHEDYRDQDKGLLEQSQLSVDEITNFVDHLIEKYSLRKVSLSGGEPLLNVVFPRSAAVIAHANRRGLEVQLNTGGLGEVEIRDVVSMFDDPQKLVLRFSFDGANRETVDHFCGRAGVYRSALRQMFEAVHCGALVQARITINRHNIGEALDAYRLLSSIGIDAFRVKPIFASAVALDSEDALLVSIDDIRVLQEAMIRMAAETSTRLELPPPILVDTSKPRPNVKYAECDCGIASVFLSINGDLYPCPHVIGDPGSAEYFVGNVRRSGFDLETAWRTSPAVQRCQAINGCANCPSQLTLLKNVHKRALACA